jgi:hypothetical protein
MLHELSGDAVNDVALEVSVRLENQMIEHIRKIKPREKWDNEMIFVPLTVSDLMRDEVMSL